MQAQGVGAVNGSNSDGVPAVVEASDGVPEVDGGDNVNCCLCSLDSIEVLDSVIGVGVLLERVSSQLPCSSGSLSFVLTPEGRDMEEPWSEFNASLVFVYDEEKQNSQKVKEIRFRKLRPKTGRLCLMRPRRFGKLRRSKTSNGKALYAKGFQLSLENCPNCRYKDFRSTKGIWKVASEVVCELRKIRKCSLWHFDFLGTIDDIKWLNDAHPTAVPKTCLLWQKKCAEKAKKALESKKSTVDLDKLEFADLWEVKARLRPITRIFWKAMSWKCFLILWIFLALSAYAIFVFFGITRFANALIGFDIIDALKSENISQFWKVLIIIFFVIWLYLVFILPVLRVTAWSKKTINILYRHKLMQSSRARKVRKNTSN